jgi:hypothetical protein
MWGFKSSKFPAIVINIERPFTLIAFTNGPTMTEPNYIFPSNPYRLAIYQALASINDNLILS